MKRAFFVMVSFVILCGATPAVAALYQESISVDTASSMSGAVELSSGIDQISGYLKNGSNKALDADLYSLYWSGGTFSMNTLGTLDDTKLYLFDSAGHGIAFNDDYCSNSNWASVQINNLASGHYFVGITASGVSPKNSAGVKIFPDFTTGQRDPNDSSFILASWGGSNSKKSYAYTINFMEVTGSSKPYSLGDAHPTGSPVPVPPALLLFGSGLSGLVYLKRRASSLKIA